MHHQGDNGALCEWTVEDKVGGNQSGEVALVLIESYTCGLHCFPLMPDLNVFRSLSTFQYQDKDNLN